MWLTFYNGSDSMVYSWFPSALQFKADTGRKAWSTLDGAFADPTINPWQTVVQKWYTADSAYAYPPCVYRIQIDVHRDKPAVGMPTTIMSNEFQVAYRP
jgi:hypothetical protein